MRQPPSWHSGIEFHGTKGRLFISKRGKLELLGEKNEKIADPKPKQAVTLPVAGHQLDFVDAIRNNRAPNAEIAIGHLSASLCHLANIASRTGTALQFDPATETIQNNPAATALLGRKYREDGHWAIPRSATN